MKKIVYVLCDLEDGSHEGMLLLNENQVVSEKNRDHIGYYPLLTYIDENGEEWEESFIDKMIIDQDFRLNDVIFKA